MRLLAVKDVRSRLALPDDEGINDVIKSALDGTTALFESRLTSAFDKASRSDIFLTQGKEFLSSEGFFRLKLATGFVRATPAVTIKWASLLSDLSVGESIALTDCIVDYEKGFVLVPFDEYSTTAYGTRRLVSSLQRMSYNGYFKVTYEYGFNDTAEVPSWLREAALAYAIKVMSMQQVSDKKDERMTSIFGFINRHGEEILDQHLRYHNMAIPPIA